MLVLSEPQFPHIIKWGHWVEGHPPGLAPTAFTSVLPQQLPLPPEETEGKIVLSGSPGMTAEGPFAVDAESGFLLVTRVLDREEQAEYQLQVWLGLM